MGDYETTSDLNEQIWLERLDADREQAELEAEGNRYARRQAKVQKLLAQADAYDAVGGGNQHALGLAARQAAQALCHHGHTGKLDGLCSEDDERYGEEGYRCYECGAVVTGMNGDVMEVK